MISCKEYVEIKKQELKKEVEKMDRKPCLCVIQIDDNPASNSYIKGKKKDCDEIGILCEHFRYNSSDLDQNTLEKHVLEVVNGLKPDGLIIQLPIPDKYDLTRVMQYIPSDMDVDGFRRDSKFKPCTPKGIMDWLDYNGVELRGKDVVIIGRSDIVGKPLTTMMIEKGATVSCCNSKTKNLKYYTRNADIVISAIGQPKYFDSKYFKKEQIIIDVGINRDENGKLCGDVNSKYIYDSYVTPSPGGVGLMTRLCLLENVLEAHKLKEVNKC